MRLIVRLFFRFVRLILTPFMLLTEKLTTPKAIVRSDEQQARVNEACRQLALYQFLACPFCVKVRKEIARLGLNIEKRDAQHNSMHRSELASSGGKIKVPCLRINAPLLNTLQTEGQTTGEQQTQWLFESADIISYLRQRFDDKTE